MIAPFVRCGWLCVLSVLSSTTYGCDSGSFPLFGCEAASSRKFIELCAPSPLDAQSGYLVYRFGSLDKDGAEKAVELEYPENDAGSLKRFYAATYTHGGVHTQSVRFVSGNFGYTVFTRSRAWQPSLLASKCATARAARRRPSRAASGRDFTSLTSRDWSLAIPKGRSASRA